MLMATWVRPKLLLLDEHTAALDPKSADQVIRLTEDIVSRDKLTTLMVTHSMQQAASLGDRLVMMHRGQIIHDLRARKNAAPGSMICWRASRRSGAGSNSTKPPRRCPAGIRLISSALSGERAKFVRTS